MLIKSIQERDWTDLYSPDNYDPLKLQRCILALAEQTIDDLDTFCEQLYNAFGHHHSGVYYPIIIDVIEILEQLLKCSYINERSKRLICSIFNDIYYFEAQVSPSASINNKELTDIVRNRLANYSDSHFPTTILAISNAQASLK